MTNAISCGFGRAFLWENRGSSLTALKKNDQETDAAFKKRVDDERFHLYTKNFEDYPNLKISKGKFH